MPKQVVVFIAAAALALLPAIFKMKGLCAEIPKSHITCNAGTYSAGTTAYVTCNFHKDMNTDKRPISVVRYPKGTPVDDPGTAVLLCQWKDREQDYNCELEKGFSIDGKITNHLRLKLPADTGNFTGLYSCFIMHAEETLPNACELNVKDVGVVSTSRGKNDTTFRQDKGKRSLLWLLILPAFFIAVAGAVIFYRYRSTTTLETDRPPEIDPLICCTSNGVSPKSNKPCPKDVTDFELSKEDLKPVMDRVDQELTASLKGDTLLTCAASVQSLPTKSASGAFLVVDLTKTTLRVHLVRLQDSQRSGSWSKIYVIPDVTERGNDEEFQLFDFIANNVHDFMTEHKLFSKKFRLVFMLSFACEYDADFSNARLTKWTNGFCCDGAVGRGLKELLQEALDRKNQKHIDSQRSQKLKKILKANIIVGVVTNDTVGLLMSEAYKDPRCKIALCLIDGFTASYLQPYDNQPTANGSIHNHTKVATTHLGGLGENDCVVGINNESDRRLDESTRYSGEHTLEKMTSVLYIGEMVRLKLVQLREKGQIFANCPPVSSKLDNEGSISADDVSLIRSDTSGNLITKHLWKKLDIDHYTEEDCQAVRSVCKAVTERAADLAAAGLATLINRLGDPDITVAIEGRLKEYYPGFLNQMEKRTKELVNPDLQFEIVRSQEGSSTGAALLAAAVFPSFPKMAPNTVTSGH